MTEKKKPTINTEFHKGIMNPEERKKDDGLDLHPDEHFKADEQAKEEFKKVPPKQRTEADLQQNH